MNNKTDIKSGEYWKIIKKPSYLVLVKNVFLEVVFFEHDGFSASLKKKMFLRIFEYSHYAPTHQEMG